MLRLIAADIHSYVCAQTNRKRVGEDDVYMTELREPLSHSPQDKTFFVRLDAQLTKINKFYKRKEGEYIARAGLLEKQMLALINLEEDMARQGLVTLDYLTPGDQDRRLPGTVLETKYASSYIESGTRHPTIELERYSVICISVSLYPFLYIHLHI